MLENRQNVVLLLLASVALLINNELWGSGGQHQTSQFEFALGNATAITPSPIVVASWGLMLSSVLIVLGSLTFGVPTSSAVISPETDAEYESDISFYMIEISLTSDLWLLLQSHQWFVADWFVVSVCLWRAFAFYRYIYRKPPSFWLQLMVSSIFVWVVWTHANITSMIFHLNARQSLWLFGIESMLIVCLNARYGDVVGFGNVLLIWLGILIKM